MTAKQDAKELFDKMLFCYQGHIDEYTAKQCALIAVSFILSRCIDEEEQYRAYKYWTEVKQEINKL